MRNVWLIFTMSILLVACASKDDERYDDFDIIDMEDPYNERAVIERGLEEQRTIMKPGFIPDHSALREGVRLSNYSITYDFATEELLHEETYSHKMSDLSMTFAAEKNSSTNRYEETVDEMVEKQSFNDMTGYYGYTENRDKRNYTYAIHEDDTSYFFDRGWWDDGFFDEEFVQLLGKSLRTEEEGAYDYFYDQFAFDIDELHFPLLNKAVVKNAEITISNLWYTEDGSSNALYVRYDLTDGTRINFIVNGMETTARLDSLSEVETIDTANGVPVTIYEADESSDTYYTWEKGEYFYSIVLNRVKSVLTTDDIYAIIDSSTDDDRSFATPELFDQPIKEPSLTDVDQGILERVKGIAEEGDSP